MGAAGADLLSDPAPAVGDPPFFAPSDSIVTGLDNGDGLPTRLAASEDELLGGMETSFGESGDALSEEVESWAGLPVGLLTLLRLAD